MLHPSYSWPMKTPRTGDHERRKLRPYFSLTGMSMETIETHTIETLPHRPITSIKSPGYPHLYLCLDLQKFGYLCLDPSEAFFFKGIWRFLDWGIQVNQKSPLTGLIYCSYCTFAKLILSQILKLRGALTINWQKRSHTLLAAESPLQS